MALLLISWISDEDKFTEELAFYNGMSRQRTIARNPCNLSHHWRSPTTIAGDSRARAASSPVYVRKICYYDCGNRLKGPITRCLFLENAREFAQHVCVGNVRTRACRRFFFPPHAFRVYIQHVAVRQVYICVSPFLRLRYA